MPSSTPATIAAEERQLPRQTRVVLAQLRSGWCSRLNSYWSRIDAVVRDACPACDTGPHNTLHLLYCTAKSTQLTPEDLWLQPVKVAEFLNLELEPD